MILKKKYLRNELRFEARVGAIRQGDGPNEAGGATL